MNRYLLPMTLCVFISCSVSISAAADDIAAAILRCRDESDNSVRLRCYDQAANVPAQNQANGKSGDKTRDTTSASVNAAAPSADPSDFGISNGPLAAQQAKTSVEIKAIVAKLTDVSARPHGEFVVTLDNGQVWQQLQATSFRLRPGDQVTIKTGVLGSYILVSPSGRAAKVKRQK